MKEPHGRQSQGSVGQQSQRRRRKVADAGLEAVADLSQVDLYLGVAGGVPAGIRLLDFPWFQVQKLDLLRKCLGVSGPRDCLMDGFRDQGLGGTAGDLGVGVIGDDDFRPPDAHSQHELPQHFIGSPIGEERVPGPDELLAVRTDQMLRQGELPERFPRSAPGRADRGGEAHGLAGASGIGGSGVC